jgi:hypothetical protein
LNQCDSASVSFSLSFRPPVGKANLASLAKICPELRTLTVSSGEKPLYQHQTDHFLQLAVALPRLAFLTIQG